MRISAIGAIKPETPAEMHAYGREVHRRATSPQWPRSVRDMARAEAGALLDALEIFEAMENRVLTPEAVWDEVAGRPEARHDAMVLQGQAVYDLALELIRRFPAAEPVAEAEEAA